MKQLLRMAAVFVLGAGLMGAASPRAAADVNIANRCQITAQHPLPNALWTPSMVADDEIGPIKGWLAYWGSDAKPWIRFKLPRRMTITGMEVMPATFPETGGSRFTRPQLVTIDFFDGKQSEKIAFELADDEQSFQTLEFEPRAADAIMITIESVYMARARIDDLTGFQEVRIFSPAEPGMDPTPATQKNTDSRNSEPDSLEYDESGQGTLSDDEREILDLLRALLDRLEEEFLKD